MTIQASRQSDHPRGAIRFPVIAIDFVPSSSGQQGLAYLRLVACSQPRQAPAIHVIPVADTLLAGVVETNQAEMMARDVIAEIRQICGASPIFAHWNGEAATIIGQLATRVGDGFDFDIRNWGSVITSESDHDSEARSALLFLTGVLAGMDPPPKWWPEFDAVLQRRAAAVQ